MKKKKDPRAGEYSEIESDDSWLQRDTPGATSYGWGGDDSHTDMINFVPEDWALVLWKTDGHRERWLERADAYEADYDYAALTANNPEDADCYPEEHPFTLMIRERVAELDARFDKLGVIKKKRR